VGRKWEVISNRYEASFFFAPQWSSGWRYEASFGGDENILKVMLAQLECIKNH
jgi:hypothetical protein